MLLAYLELRNITSYPMSSTLLCFFEGMSPPTTFDIASSRLMPSSSASSMSFCFWAVNTKPGQIALQVIPDRAFSSAVDLVSPTRACLDATRAPFDGNPTRPCTPAIFMILPQPFCCMQLNTPLVVQKELFRLTLIVSSHTLLGISSMRSLWCFPALLTRMSIPPNRRIECRTMQLMSSGLLRSAQMNSTLLEEVRSSRSLVLISSSEPKPWMIMLVPAFTRAVAIPLPIPDNEPVTRAVLPVRLMIILDNIFMAYEMAADQSPLRCFS